ncbi:chitosanase [Kribbella sp. NPDC056861]|uniref:chitosanase n=1 Tax=Kribbella sp. NPDC056861 TaxID=3154857 RepID=UPI003421461A
MPDPVIDADPVLAGVLLALTIAAEPREAFGAPDDPLIDGLSAGSTGLEDNGSDAPDPWPDVLAMVSSLVNGSTAWQTTYAMIAAPDGDEYRAGLAGFTLRDGVLYELVRLYCDRQPGNVLEKYLDALRTEQLGELGAGFRRDWQLAAADPAFRAAQDEEHHRLFLRPAAELAGSDGLGALGQFVYYDAMVMHGAGGGWMGFAALRDQARRTAVPPADGGDECRYLTAFLDSRHSVTRLLPARPGMFRLESVQRELLGEGNLELERPLCWQIGRRDFHLA